MLLLFRNSQYFASSKIAKTNVLTFWKTYHIHFIYNIIYFLKKRMWEIFEAKKDTRLPAFTHWMLAKLGPEEQMKQTVGASLNTIPYQTLIAYVCVFSYFISFCILSSEKIKLIAGGFLNAFPNQTLILPGLHSICICSLFVFLLLLHLYFYWENAADSRHPVECSS